MKDSNSPLSFWDYCVERRARINNATARDRLNLGATDAHTQFTGEKQIYQPYESLAGINGVTIMTTPPSFLLVGNYWVNS